MWAVVFLHQGGHVAFYLALKTRVHPLSPLFDGEGWIGKEENQDALLFPAYMPSAKSKNRWRDMSSPLHQFDSAMLVGWRYNSWGVMKYILRDRRGLKAAETKHAGSVGWWYRQGAGSPLIHAAVLINQHASFICVPPVFLALDWWTNSLQPLRLFDIISSHGLHPLHWASLVLRDRATRWMDLESSYCSFQADR